MTDSTTHEPGVNSAHEVRMQAAAWLQRRQFWTWSEADQAELDLWLAKSSSHQVAYMRVKAVWGRTERLTALRRAPVVPRIQGSPFEWPPLARSVAAVAIVAVLGFVDFRVFTATDQTTWTTPVGGRRILTLLDGSQIELNTNTVLRIAANQRMAWLDRGEAYFEIKHNSARPFVVTAAGKRVVDIGTKFLIRNSIDGVEVALVEGRARIEPVKAGVNAQVAILTPGDVATATPSSLSVVKRPARNLVNELGWRRNLLIFDNATLAEVAAELNRYNQEKLVIADPSLARLRIDASIPTNGIQAFKRVARNFLGLHVEDRGEEIIISR